MSRGMQLLSLTTSTSSVTSFIVEFAPLNRQHIQLSSTTAESHPQRIPLALNEGFPFAASLLFPELNSEMRRRPRGEPFPLREATLYPCP